MANKNWFDDFRKENAEKSKVAVPSLKRNYDIRTLLGEPFFDGPLATPWGHSLASSWGHLSNLMKEFEGFGFQDKGDHYEMVADLGGQRGGDTPDDAVKVELTGEDSRIVTITYEHSKSTDDNSFYSHSQKTSVTLPDDADESTIKATFDDDDNVLITVKKIQEKEEPKDRSIPITRK